ncbi:MAG: cytidylate kinase-like family protein [Bacteroidales bacterium]|nr:cytidylate kinase-like family protein [Bacteroidales bacterium]
MATKIDLAKYARDRLQKREQNKTGSGPGPVITISREFGCPSKKIASDLTDAINTKRKKDKWYWVSKEILAESADQLGLHPDEIKYVFDYKKKGIVEEIIAAQSKKYYRSDKKIRNTIGKVIKRIAETGNVIIIGRGGAAIANDIKNSLHIKLIADIKWRAKNVGKIRDMNIDDAIKFTLDYDKKRKIFLDYYWGETSDYSIFDLIYNCNTMSSEEIVTSIIHMLERRKIL